MQKTQLKYLNLLIILITLQINEIVQPLAFLMIKELANEKELQSLKLLHLEMFGIRSVCLIFLAK